MGVGVGAVVPSPQNAVVPVGGGGGGGGGGVANDDSLAMSQSLDSINTTPEEEVSWKDEGERGESGGCFESENCLHSELSMIILIHIPMHGETDTEKEEEEEREEEVEECSDEDKGR